MMVFVLTTILIHTSHCLLTAPVLPGISHGSLAAYPVVFSTWSYCCVLLCFSFISLTIHLGLLLNLISRALLLFSDVYILVVLVYFWGFLICLFSLGMVVTSSFLVSSLWKALCVVGSLPEVCIVLFGPFVFVVSMAGSISTCRFPSLVTINV